MDVMSRPKFLSRLTLPDGVPAILGAVFAMALTDAIIKRSSAGMSLWQIWTLRSAMVLPVLFVLARGQVPGRKPGRGLIWVWLRSLALIAMYFCMYPALPFIDLSLAGAAFYTAPLFILGLSAVVLGQKITVRHWMAILTGFAGLLVIVRPFGAAFTPVVFGPVAAAACYAVAAVLTRARCAEVAPAVQAFWLNAAFLVFGIAGLSLNAAGLPLPSGLPFLFAPWQPMSPGNWATMAVLAVLILGVALGVAKAYQAPQPAIIATFDYCYMIFAIFWGNIFFGEVPDGWTLAGMALIAAGGIGALMIGDADATGPAAPSPAT